MRIASNNYSCYKTETNFKSTYPVVHRIIVNDTYIPVSKIEIIKKLQRKLVCALNSSFEKLLSELDREAQMNVHLWTRSESLEHVKPHLKLPATEKEAFAIFQGRFGYSDLDYCYASNKKQRVRSFYNREKSLIDGKYYIAYMISGNDIKAFEDDLAKDIGKAKRESKSISGNVYSQKTKDKIKSYNTKGLDFVNSPEYRLTSKCDGKKYVLQSNFEPVKNKKGRIVDYKFVSAKFVPES